VYNEEEAPLPVMVIGADGVPEALTSRGPYLPVATFTVSPGCAALTAAWSEQ
jgi:hypothetical protein